MFIVGPVPSPVTKRSSRPAGASSGLSVPAKRRHEDDSGESSGDESHAVRDSSPEVEVSPERDLVPVPRKRSRREHLEEPVERGAVPPSRPTPRPIGSSKSHAATTSREVQKAKGKAIATETPRAGPSTAVERIVEAPVPPAKRVRVRNGTEVHGTALVEVKNGKGKAVLESALDEYLRRWLDERDLSKIDKSLLLEEVAHRPPVS